MVTKVPDCESVQLLFRGQVPAPRWERGGVSASTKSTASASGCRIDHLAPGQSRAPKFRCLARVKPRSGSWPDERPL